MRAPKPGVNSLEDPLIQTTLRYTAANSDSFNDMQLEPISFLQGFDAESLLVGLAPVVEKTRGHGRLRFHSADVNAQPIIESDFLNDDWDLERLVEGIEIALRFAQTPEIRAVTERIVRPRPEEMADRDKLAAWAKRSPGSGYHPCGRAPTGTEGDPTPVLEQHARALGVRGLHVADASIMPTIPRANINIPSIMIGERFGEWFREEAL